MIENIRPTPTILDPPKSSEIDYGLVTTTQKKSASEFRVSVYIKKKKIIIFEGYDFRSSADRVTDVVHMRFIRKRFSLSDR